MVMVAGSQRTTTWTRYDPELGVHPGAPIRAGLVVIATDHTSERDLRRMLPPAMDIVVSRVPCRTVTTVETLGEMANDLTRAADLLLPGSVLNVIAFACTTGAIVIGETEVARRIRLARPGIAVTTPIEAAMAACRALGIKRLSLVLPYVLAVNRRVVSRLEAEGLDVVSVVSFEQESDLDMARVTPAAIIDAGIAADRPGADGVFVSCTALRAAEAAEQLETRIGKAVITSNQALAWHLLRLTGIATSVAGYGALLRKH